MKKLLILLSSIALAFGAVPALAGSQNYGDVTLSGGFQAGHFDDVWDLTAGDITISFTYDANGLVDDFGGSAHAWAELGVRTAQPPYPDFNPNWSGDICSEQTFDLLAGQNMDVGDVIVQRVGDILYVKYVITEDGWCLTETHLHVADSLGGIPQTKKGNPIPGQFDYKEEHGCVTEYAYPPIDVSGLGMTLYIAAHAAVIKLIGEGCEPPQWASEVLEYHQGTLVGGGPIDNPARMDPIAALGSPDASTSPPAEGFYSLGFVSDDDGYIILGFDHPIYNGPGDDIKVYEVTWGRAGYPREAAKVYVISDGDEYDAGTVTNHDDNGVGSVSIPDELLCVDAVKLVDDTYVSDFVGMPNADGYDLDAVGACYLFGGEETAWGDGDDFPGKNWATCIVYQPDCTSVQGSGVWLATDYDWAANTFDPDPPGAPTQDLDDKLILQKLGGQGEGAYNLPSAPPNPWANHRIWFDRDDVDMWQAMNPLAVDGGTYNTGGIYDIVITLHADDDTSGTAYMTVNGLDQGFETDGNWNTMELTPAGMTFSGDMKHLQVFYGLYGYGATHTVTFEQITVTQ